MSFEKNSKKIPGRVFRPSPETRVPGRVLGLRIFRAGFRVLKLFFRVLGRAPGFILKFSEFRNPEPGPRPFLVSGPRGCNQGSAPRRFYRKTAFAVAVTVLKFLAMRFCGKDFRKWR